MQKLKNYFFWVLIVGSFNIVSAQNSDLEKVMLQLSTCSYDTEFGTYFFEGEIINEGACLIKISEMDDYSLQRSYEFNMQYLNSESISIYKSDAGEYFGMEVYTTEPYNIDANIFGKDRIGKYFLVYAQEESTLQQLKEVLVTAIASCQ